MKLIKLSEYVSSVDLETTLSNMKDSYRKVFNYMSFIIQPLTLSMFLPVGENGEVLESPKNYNKWLRKELNTPYNIAKCEEYQKALDRVFFKMPKGWNVFTTGEYLRIITNEADYYYDEENTIEDIIDLVELNDNGVKQAGL